MAHPSHGPAQPRGWRPVALCALAFLFALSGSAQVPVPFSTAEGRFMIFANGRFEKMEPRPPKAVFAMDGQVVYTDHEDRLRIFIAEGRKLHALEDAASRTMKATRQRLAWLRGDTLKVLRAGKAEVVSTGVARFVVTDSLVVYHDSVAKELRALWRNGSVTLATIERSTEAEQWMQGDALAVFFEKATRRLLLFQHGRVRTLCDSTDVGIVTVGSELMGYWDDHWDRFMVSDRGREEELSGLRPVSAKAGKGLLAFVDGAGGLRCYAKGRTHRLTDTIPSAYWVQDSLLLFVRGNELHLFDGERAQRVERYVPERWQVEGGLLVYLDINRELRGIVNGQRIRFGTEANIPRFELFGDAVMYPSPTGLVTVVRRGRTYAF